MARTSIKLELADDRRDHAYDRDHGWFDSDYYYATKLGLLKRAAGVVFRPDGGLQLETEGHRAALNRGGGCRAN